MQFVKSSVYQAEITEGGVREREVDTRSREEVELQERLRRLPEFSRSEWHEQPAPKAVALNCGVPLRLLLRYGTPTLLEHTCLPQ